MKNLILVIMLIAIGATLPIEAFAKVDPATLEKQRATNKARLEKNQELRTGKPLKRLFSKSEVEANKSRSLKLDAIPSSPRRRAKSISSNSERTFPANPGGRIASTAKPEHSPEAATATQE